MKIYFWIFNEKACFSLSGKVRCIGGIECWNEKLTLETLKKVENHWKGRIEAKKFEEEKPEEKFYILSMFPYPSGFLHLGHVRVYGTGDVLARYHRLKGKNVLHPMGWDAFGLPAENAAFERGVEPDVWTQTNIADMKTVMEELNFEFDWSREFATCDSDYVRWTQFLFLKLFERGLAYRKEAYVNWDPVDKTVLADEQVDSEGRSWRSGALIEKKLLLQWFIKTTAFSKSLSEGLEDLISKGWKNIVSFQKNWIGEVNGTTIDFEIVENVAGSNGQKRMPIWMKNPEFINKAKFVAVKPNSFWTFGRESDDLLPYRVKNIFTGDVLPVYRTDLISFAEGAEIHLGIPELSEVDKNFAESAGIPFSVDPYPATEEELLRLRDKICAEAQERKLGGYPTSSKLKDWLVSRQRYWGTPIPIIHCETCGSQPVPEKELPVRLPRVSSLKKGENPLNSTSEWFRTSCPRCGGPATRETDTMDTFVDSSWYYLRFLDPDNEAAAFDVGKAKKLMPVDLYVGGEEHATLHLFYARFVNHFLHSLGLVPQREPFDRFLSQGVVRALTYKVQSTGEYLSKDSVEEIDGKFYKKNSREPLVEEWEKMSKSKHNSVVPKQMIAKYGVDLTRIVVLRQSSVKSIVNWNEKLFHDIFMWLGRLWLTIADFLRLRTSPPPRPDHSDAFAKAEFYIFDSRNFYLIKITDLMEKTNDVGIALMKLQGLTNSLRKCDPLVVAHSPEFERALALQIILLAPFAPYFASELWAGFSKAPNRLCRSGEILWDRPVFQQPWPRIDPHYQFRSDQISSMIKTNESETKQQRKSKKRKEKKKAKQEKENPEEPKDDLQCHTV